MKPSWQGLIQVNPFRRRHPWNYRSSYFVVDFAMLVLWFARIFFPGAWIGALFSYKGTDGRYYAQARAMEVYLITVFAFGVVAGLTSILDDHSGIVALLSILLIAEIIHYHVWIMLFRPTIDKSYIQYNALRTVLLTLLAFLNVVNLYGALYHSMFRCNFDVLPFPWQTWAYSVGEITGSGYGGLTTDNTLGIALASGSEKLIGVFFLVIIIVISLARMEKPEIGANSNSFSSED